MTPRGPGTCASSAEPGAEPGSRGCNGRPHSAGVGVVVLEAICSSPLVPTRARRAARSAPASVAGGRIGRYGCFIPGPSQIKGVDLPGLLALVITLVVVFAPLLLGRRASPGQSDAEPGDGGGGEPRQPRRPPNSPSGAIPLEDAEPARVRLRNPDRLSDLLPRRTRRGSRGPVRPPTRTLGAGAAGGDPHRKLLTSSLMSE